MTKPEWRTKKLYRSKENRIVGGVCGGLGEYLGINPTLIRLLWLLFIFVAGAGVAAYVIAMLIIPEKPQTIISKESFKRYLDGLS
jgi:phage shock protein PspC (stress-responsive transcriptional regulator)